MQYLFGEFSERIFDTLVRDHIDVDIYHEILTQEILDRFHAEGLVVNCWTVDKKERAEELAGMGIDDITTNILE